MGDSVREWIQYTWRNSHLQHIWLVSIRKHRDFFVIVLSGRWYSTIMYKVLSCLTFFIWLTNIIYIVFDFLYSFYVPTLWEVVFRFALVPSTIYLSVQLDVRPSDFLSGPPCFLRLEILYLKPKNTQYISSALWTEHFWLPFVHNACVPEYVRQPLH